MCVQPTYSVWGLIQAILPGFDRDELLVIARGFRRSGTIRGPVSRIDMLLCFTKFPRLCRDTKTNARKLQKKIENLSLSQVSRLSAFFMSVVKPN